MKIFEYLEYLTQKERQKAAKEGQTNLETISNNKIAADVNTKKIDPDPFYLQIKNSWYKSSNNDYVKKNILPDGKKFRICMAYSGIYYACSPKSLTHNDLIAKAWIDGAIDHSIKVNKHAYSYYDVIYSWNKTAGLYYFKFFICLSLDIKNKKYIFMSESYPDMMLSELDQDFNLRDHYDKLTRKIFNRKLICESLDVF